MTSKLDKIIKDLSKVLIKEKLELQKRVFRENIEIGYEEDGEFKVVLSIRNE